MQTILLIDDDVDSLVVLAEALSRTEHHIIPRFDAESALSVVREGTRIDLVITDYKMPGMDGSEFMMTLRCIVPSVPVIVLTGHGSVNTYIQAMSHAAFEYITKPVSLGKLTRIVHSAPGDTPIAEVKLTGKKGRFLIFSGDIRNQKQELVAEYERIVGVI